MRSIGIDIGSFSVKVAEVESTRADFNLTAYAEFPLTQTPGADHQLEIIEILRKIATNYDLNTTRFVFSIPQSRVSSRFKRFPFRERQKILKSIAFELEDEIPLDLDEAVFDAKIVQFVGNTADVLAFAAPNEFVSEAISRAKDGGIDPEILSADGVALSNLFEGWNNPPAQRPAQPVLDLGEGLEAPVEPPTPARLILHLGHSRTHLLVYRGETLVSVRSILWGGSEIARALAKVFSLPASEGIKILKSKSFILMNSLGASKDQVVLSQAVSTEVNTLVQELKLTLLDLRTEFNISFAGLELMGPVALIQNLGAYLTQALEMPVNTLQNMAVTAAFEPGAAVAVGLAIEGLKRPRNPAINFRKGIFAKQNKSLALFWETWKTSLQIGATAIVAIFIYSIARDTLASRLADKADDALITQGKRVAGLRNQSQIEHYIKTQNTKIKNREVLAQLDSVNSALDILASLSQKMPVADKATSSGKMELDVRHFSLHNEDLVIEGKVQNPKSLTNVETSLKQVGENVRRSQPTHVIDGPGTAFGLHARVSRQ